MQHSWHLCSSLSLLLVLPIYKPTSYPSLQHYSPTSLLSPPYLHFASHTRCSLRCTTNISTSVQNALFIHTQWFYSDTVDLNIPVNLLVDKAVATQITPSNQLLYLSYFAVPNVCIYYGIHEREISDLLPVSPSFRRWCRTKWAAF